MKRHFLLLLSAVVGILCCGCAKESIGIIGGADGPTAILIGQSSTWRLVELIVLAILVVVMLIYVLKKRKKK